MKVTMENIKHFGGKLQKPVKQLPGLTMAVAGKAVKQQLSNTKEYLLHAASHLKMLPKIRSLDDVTHFATEAGNRSIAYAKKTLAVLQEGAHQYQGWAKKTAKTLGLKTSKRKPVTAAKKTVSARRIKKTGTA